MIINVISSKKNSKRKIKSKLNHLLKCKGNEWVDGEYMFDNMILYHVKKCGISFESIDNTPSTYSAIRECIEQLFAESKISIYGTYDSDQMSLIDGVEIQRI